VRTSLLSLVATTTAGPRFENIVPAGRGAVTVPEIWPKAWPATAKSKSALPICQRAAIGRRDEAFTGVSSFAIGQGPALERCGPVARSYSPGLQLPTEEGVDELGVHFFQSGFSRSADH